MHQVFGLLYRRSGLIFMTCAGLIVANSLATRMYRYDLIGGVGWPASNYVIAGLVIISAVSAFVFLIKSYRTDVNAGFWHAAVESMP